MPSPSSTFTGHVMRKDTPVAQVRNSQLISVAKNAPLYLQKRGDFQGWLKDRGADLTRGNMRIILKQLGLPLQDIETAVKSVNAASITDSFWIKPHDSNILYNDIVFKSDTYSKAALAGDPDIFTLPKNRSPELTNIGSFNKGWKLENGKWYLYKSGTAQEIFSELFTSKLARLLNMDAVNYFIKDGYIVCESFVSSTQDLETAKAIIGENCDYPHVYNIMESHGLAKSYMDIIFMDAIVRNTDRHEFRACCHYRQ